MNTKQLTLPLCLVLALPTLTMAATAESGPYIRVFGGAAFTPKNIDIDGFSHPNYKTGYNVGGQLGYKSGPLRYEIDGSYTYNRLKNFLYNSTLQTTTKGKTNFFATTVNAIVDFEDMSASFVPYLGLGLGYGQVNTELQSTAPNNVLLSKKGKALAYKGLAGLSYNFSENATIDLGYQYVRTKKKGKFGKVYQTHGTNLGLTYRFDSV